MRHLCNSIATADPGHVRSKQLINQIPHRRECPTRIRAKDYLSTHLQLLGLMPAMEQPHIGKSRLQLGQRRPETAGRFKSPPMRAALSSPSSQKKIGL